MVLEGLFVLLGFVGWFPGNGWMSFNCFEASMLTGSKRLPSISIPGFSEKKLLSFTSWKTSQQTTSPSLNPKPNYQTHLPTYLALPFVLPCFTQPKTHWFDLYPAPTGPFWGNCFDLEFAFVDSLPRLWHCRDARGKEALPTCAGHLSQGEAWFYLSAKSFTFFEASPFGILPFDSYFCKGLKPPTSFHSSWVGCGVFRVLARDEGEILGSE